MRITHVLIAGAIGSSAFGCYAQQSEPRIPDAPVPLVVRPATADSYAPPTQSQRVKSYVRQTYGYMSIFEAGARAGIEQARDNPGQWPQGGEGYADRFGSASGEIVVRGTTEYLLADLFREDLRRVRCAHPCSQSRFKLAFDNSFLARRGDDGHESFSVARIVGPFSGSAVAINTWYPAGSGRSNVARGAVLQFGLIYVRNLVRVSLSR